MPAVPDPRPSRRALFGLLVGGVAGVTLGGCGVQWSKVRVDVKGTPAPPTVSADDAARFEAVTRVTAAAQVARQTTGGDLAALAADAATWHEAQLRELGPLPGPVPSGSPTPSGWPTSSPGAAADLLAAEQAVAGLLVGVEEREAGLAALLTSIATCSAGIVRAAGGQPQAPVPNLRGRLAADAPEEVVTAVTALLAADRRAAFVYGPLAAPLTGGDRERAVRAMRAHGDRALRTEQLLKSADLEVPTAPAAYDVPVPEDAATAVRAAAELEAACAEAAADLIRLGQRPANLLGIAALVDAGQLQSAWGGAGPFPGLPELA